MISLEVMILLDRLNTLSSLHGKSYALLGNNSSLQLFVSTKGDTFEVCHGTAKTIKGVLKTLLNAIPVTTPNTDNTEE